MYEEDPQPDDDGNLCMQTSQVVQMLIRRQRATSNLQELLRKKDEELTRTKKENEELQRSEKLLCTLLRLHLNVTAGGAATAGGGAVAGGATADGTAFKPKGADDNTALTTVPKAPVSNDLLDKVIQQNVRLRTILRDVLKQNGLSVYTYLKYEDAATTLQHQLGDAKKRISQLESIIKIILQKGNTRRDVVMKRVRANSI